MIIMKFLELDFFCLVEQGQCNIAWRRLTLFGLELIATSNYKSGFTRSSSNVNGHPSSVLLWNSFTQLLVEPQFKNITETINFHWTVQ